MSETPLLDIARDWSHWTEPPPRSVPRSVQVPKEFRPDIALVVQGVRRCGKSTLLKQLMDRYALDRTKCLFINFEDPRLAGSLNHQCLQSLVDAFEADRGAGCTYFLDEIQGVAGWERWLRSQLDRSGKRRFAVTGSNAHLLSGELGSVLTGRHHTVELFPFDLAEYRALRPRCTLTEYLTNGGFPATVASPDHAMMLRNYFQDIVERDVRSRVGARSSAPLRQLAQMLFEGAGSETSMRRIAAALDVSIDTASLYTQAISDAYMCFPCEFHAWSERKRLVRNRKYYPVDPGLRRACVTPTGADLGKALEFHAASQSLRPGALLARRRRSGLRGGTRRQSHSGAGDMGCAAGAAHEGHGCLHPRAPRRARAGLRDGRFVRARHSRACAARVRIGAFGSSGVGH
ncbi:MAG: ATP-binding protein [Planctomycetes bacterium]|nr:ATP-binding protein [Planctomycetota bacterium]